MESVPPCLQTSAFQAGHDALSCDLLSFSIYMLMICLYAALSLHPCEPVKFGFHWVLLEEALCHLALRRQIYLPVSLYALKIFQYLFILLFQLPSNMVFILLIIFHFCISVRPEY